VKTTYEYILAEWWGHFGLLAGGNYVSSNYGTTGLGRYGWAVTMLGDGHGTDTPNSEVICEDED
jgi:hypothetical protein